MKDEVKEKYLNELIDFNKKFYKIDSVNGLEFSNYLKAVQQEYRKFLNGEKEKLASLTPVGFDLWSNR